MSEQGKHCYGLLLLLICQMMLVACASVDDPRKADIFTFREEKSQKFIDERQAELDALAQQRAQLDLEKEKLRRDNEEKEKERDVLLAKLSGLDQDLNSLASQVASLEMSSARMQARRKELEARIKTLKREVGECQKQARETPETAVLQKRLEFLRRKQRQLEQEYSILSGARSSIRPSPRCYRSSS